MYDLYAQAWPSRVPILAVLGGDPWFRVAQLLPRLVFPPLWEQWLGSLWSSG